MKIYRLPNGEVTDDVVIYSTVWHQLGEVVTNHVLPKSRLVAFDPDFQFNVAGKLIGLPVWFVLALSKNTRPLTGKYKRSKLVTSECEMCKRIVHKLGAGRRRRFCADCIIVRRKMGPSKED